MSKMLHFRFGLKHRISLYERIAAFLEAGIPIIDTIQTIRARYVKNKDFKAQILEDWLTKMGTGMRFGDAIQSWIPSSEHMLIAAGERGDGLIAGLREATTLSNASANSKKAIFGGVAFPVALMFVLCGMMIGFQVQMVPIFSGLMPVDRWPGDAQTLYNVSYFIKSKLVFLLAVLVALSFLIGKTIGKWKGTTRKKIFDKIPPWSIYRSYQGSSFLVGLSSLLKAGVSLNDSLKMMHSNASPWLQDHLENMIGNLKKGGENHGESLDTGLLDDEIAGDVQDYSRLGSFQDAIYILGSKSIVQGVEQIQANMAMVKQLMLGVVGGSVIWIYVTTYSLNTFIADSLQQGAK